MEPNITAIIQARMTSTRLPGKVLMEIMGRPLLSYQIERIKFCRNIDKIIIATTENKTDDPIVMLAQKEKVGFFRGSEDDVLDRYYQTAMAYDTSHIMRLTADCPLIQPDICDLIAIKYLETKVDYIHTGPSFAEGLDCEIFNHDTLNKAWKSAKLQSEHEHLTLYIRNHPELFKIKTLENEIDDSRYRITVDEDEDFEVVRIIFESLYATCKPYITIQDIKAFLESRPEVFALNKKIIRNEGLLKSLKEKEII